MKKLTFKNWKLIIIELFTVFVGVFLAFQLNDYREKQTIKDVRNKYYTLIYYEFINNLKEIENSKNNIENYITTFNTKVKNKENPPFDDQLMMDLSNNQFILKSAFNSGYLENLEPNYVLSLSNGSNYILRLNNLSESYTNKVQKTLIANNYNHDYFYKNNQVKDEFLWYINDLEKIKSFMDNLIIAIEKGAIPDTRSLIENFN